MDELAVDEPADRVRPPFEGVVGHGFRSVEAERRHELVVTLGRAEIVELDGTHILAEKLEVDFIVRFLLIGRWADIGEEGADQPRRGGGARTELIGAIAIGFMRLQFGAAIVARFRGLFRWGVALAILAQGQLQRAARDAEILG